MKIQRINFTRFWNNWNISIPLDEQVNVISGANGSGKSTLLNILFYILSGKEFPQNLLGKVFKTTVVFDDDTEFNNIQFENSYSFIKKESEKEEALKDLVTRVEEDLKNRQGSINGVQIKASVNSIRRNNQKIKDVEDFMSSLKVDMISTFDSKIPLPPTDPNSSALKDKGVETHLDLALYHLQSKYSFYLGQLANDLEHYILSDKKTDRSYLQELYSQKNLFIEIINELFSATNKKIDKGNSEIQFLVGEGNEEKRISIYELSSGEKQILYILQKVLLQNKEPYFILMDEPEISLHIDWQEVLIDKILKLNPNCQLIIASHAPSLIINGWEPKVQYLDDLKTFVNDGKQKNFIAL